MSVGLFIAIITALSLRSASGIFNNTSGRDTAARDLLKARRILLRDLSMATLAPGRFFEGPAPICSPPGGGAPGDVVNFLSAVNSTNGEVETLADGSGNPYFFRNIYFYMSVPTNHDALFGSPCTGGNESGYEYNCPHKILLRGEQDQNPAFDPTDPTTQDVLLTLPGTFLAQPTGFPRTAALQTVAINLLTFQVTRQNAELIVDLKAVSLQDARSKVGIGTNSFNTGAYTVEQRFSVFPKN